MNGCTSRAQTCRDADQVTEPDHVAEQGRDRQNPTTTAKSIPSDKTHDRREVYVGGAVDCERRD